ncbi:MAG: Holliday junction resolvase RuvX [Clostridiales bacterium]|nr:Holliday junction resolvase RuvX [Clostridiales bacterium]
MVVLGIDFGDRRIGLAKSDSLGMLASGLDTFVWKNDMDIPISHILDLTKQLKIERIVIGMPLNMDDTKGKRAEITEVFAAKLKEAVNLDIVFWDERLSSVEAKEALRLQGKKNWKDKGAVDRAAACYILQSYLDSL